MKLALCTWTDVESYLERSQLVIVPIGSTEQHGPNGIIGTDFVCAEEIAWRVGDEVDAMVAPTIPVGMALHHMAFPGTISLQPETLIAVLRDYVVSLYRHGFRTILFINGHGGNISTANAAFSALRETVPDADLHWANWYMQRPVRALAAEMFGEREGSHATPSEVSVTMAAYPNDVKTVDGPLDIDSCRSRGIPSSDRFRQWYPDGRMGSDPSMATIEHGERLMVCAVDAISERVRELQGG